jgi:uncharacterized membrane protein YkoI
MRTSSIRTAIAVTATTLALTLSACGGDDEKISSADRDKASAAALAYVGGGAVTDAERGEGGDKHAYEVEVTLPNGTDIDVELDDSFTVTNSPAKASDVSTGTPTAEPTTAPSGSAPSAVAPRDDRGLLGETLTKAKAAALKATGEGRVTETSGSDDPDHVYEVDVLLPSGEDVTVELDAQFEVVRIDR